MKKEGNKMETKQTYVCEHCGNDTTNGRQIENKFFCNDCINEHFIKCEHCGSIAGKIISDGNHNYCNNCFSKHYERCSFCGEIHNKDKMYWIISEKANCCFKCLGLLDIIGEMKEIIKNIGLELEELETLLIELTEQPY